MLDLKKLEKMLDEALAKETDESLSEWLLNKRAQNAQYIADLGEGEYQPLESECDKFSHQPNIISVDNTRTNINAGEYNYATAA